MVHALNTTEQVPPDKSYLPYIMNMSCMNPKRMGRLTATCDGSFEEKEHSGWWDLFILIVLALGVVGIGIEVDKNVKSNNAIINPPKINNVITYNGYIKDIKDPQARIRAEDAIADYLERLAKGR